MLLRNEREFVTMERLNVGKRMRGKERVYKRLGRFQGRSGDTTTALICIPGGWAPLRAHVRAPRPSVI